MSTSIAIRPLLNADLAAFFSYLNAHLQDNGRDGAPLFQPMPRAQSVFPDDKIAAFTRGLALEVGQPGWRRCWIAVDASQGGGADAIVGHVDLRARPDSHALHRTLLGMGVRRDRRRLGLGRTLLATALDWAAAQPGLDWVDLEVLSANAPALRLYRDGGFTQTGEIADMFRVDGERLAYIFMARSVAAPGERRTRGVNSD